MRVDVLRAFIDKETGQGYNVGESYENNDAERVASLYDAGFLARPKELKVSAKESTVKRTTRKKAVKTDESDRG